MNRRPLLLVARYALAAVFLWACAHKIVDPQAFAVDVFRYQLLPPTWVNPVAWGLPWVELVLSLALLAGPRWQRAGALLAMLLLLGFTAAMGYNLARGIDMSCGCFRTGDEGGTVGAWNLFRNTALAALALLVIWFSRVAPASPPQPAG